MTRHYEGGGGRLALPLNASVRTARLLVAAEVGHGLVQARAADTHERQEHQAGGQGDAQASNQPGLAHEDHRHGGQDRHQERERVADVAPNDGMGTPSDSATDLTMKFGPLPMYVIAPQNTAPSEIGIR